MVKSDEHSPEKMIRANNECLRNGLLGLRHWVRQAGRRSSPGRRETVTSFVNWSCSIYEVYDRVKKSFLRKCVVHKSTDRGIISCLKDSATQIQWIFLTNNINFRNCFHPFQIFMRRIYSQIYIILHARRLRWRERCIGPECVVSDLTRCLDFLESANRTPGWAPPSHAPRDSGIKVSDPHAGFKTF